MTSLRIRPQSIDFFMMGSLALWTGSFFPLSLAVAVPLFFFYLYPFFSSQPFFINKTQALLASLAFVTVGAFLGITFSMLLPVPLSHYLMILLPLILFPIVYYHRFIKIASSYSYTYLHVLYTVLTLFIANFSSDSLVLQGLSFSLFIVFVLSFTFYFSWRSLPLFILAPLSLFLGSVFFILYGQMNQQTSLIGSFLHQRFPHPFNQDNPSSSFDFASSSIGSSFERIQNTQRLLFRFAIQSPDQPPSIYLRSQTLNYTVNGDIWRSSYPISNSPTIPSDKGLPIQKSLSASLYFEQPWTGAVPLPLGTLPSSTLDLSTKSIQNYYFKDSKPPRFSFSFLPQSDLQPSPHAADLFVPDHLKPLLDSFIQTHHLDTLPPHRIPATLQTLFQTQWSYTLELRSLQNPQSPRTLYDFLTQDRRGHCEFFASATTLILRRLHIPSRYQTGFHVHEFHPSEQLFWIRESDAHAWSSYWNGSHWTLIDSTPPSFSAPQSPSFFATFQDQVQHYLFMFKDTVISWTHSSAPLIFMGLLILACSLKMIFVFTQWTFVTYSESFLSWILLRIHPSYPRLPSQDFYLWIRSHPSIDSASLLPSWLSHQQSYRYTPPLPVSPTLFVLYLQQIQALRLQPRVKTPLWLAFSTTLFMYLMLLRHPILTHQALQTGHTFRHTP